MTRTTLIPLLALVAGTLLALPAAARCVRDVSESGAVGVRCSDGVRGRLATDDVAPRAPTVSLRSGSGVATRGNNSALSGSGSANSALSSAGAPQSALSAAGASGAQRGPYGGGRPGDQSGGMYSITRPDDRRPY
jgi:hypothetical protein